MGPRPVPPLAAASAGVLVALCVSSSEAFAPRGRTARVPAVRRTRLAPLSVLRDLSDYSESDFGWEEGPELTAQSLDIHDVLLQRSIQTMYRYLGDTRNEMKAEWLLGFQNHTHLGDGSKWHSVIGLRLHFTDYYRHLFLAPVSEFTVRYQVGRPEGWTPPAAEDGAEEDAEEDSSGEARDTPASSTGPHPDLMGWQAAAASRRRNPYLQEKSYRTYTETLDPKLIAASLMSVSKSLSKEWREDLAILASVDSSESRLEERQRERAFTKRCRENPDADECRVDYENWRTPAFEMVERGREDSTPLRRFNFELLQRTATILAAKSLQTDLAFLAMSEQQSAAELLWFDKFMADWWRGLAEVTPVSRADGTDVGLNPVSDALFAALEHRPPVLGDDYMVDPTSLAERLYEQRESACRLLIKQLDETDNILDNIANECSHRVRLEQLLFL
mmetsp:Transcript_5243/g.15394  ORF Transcript_5243/g.15394 Transcript_5243/m.15394 type:complete len:447 (-) Transcript_5243:652-1992(-)|eukprot:CAMPEP_0118974296 /NCGR_PEP_ID=MMETSP1173-20130426/11173_1 /TAXON_ID=1034831 /ORGANISM="Rhizochromulina marina cf, Strain CCMP1243" /LENGTH=446 /DNA_ID=CAMNT_0006924011 /DNA_START=78 /DNA_END=1418 /DNA_ORIENTATION=+